MRILYVSFDEVPSYKGASTHILSGIRVPVEAHHITLLTLGTISLPRQKNFLHVPLRIEEKNYLKRALLFQERVKQFIADNKYDLIHFRGPFEGASAVELHSQTIYEVNALPSIELPYTHSALTESLLEKIRILEKRCLTSCTKIICPSEKIKTLISEVCPNINSAKILVLPNGYDPSTIVSSTNESQSMKGVYIGTLSPWQGILWSLKAFRDLGETYSLDIYSPYNKIFWRRAERRIKRYQLEDRVSLNPALHKGVLSQHLSRYDFALAPLLKTERNTRQGCCPLKILDYLSHGLPTIASDLFVVREIIKDPNYPYFFHPGSVLSLKATLERMRVKRCTSEYILSLLKDHLTWKDYGTKLCHVYVC